MGRTHRAGGVALWLGTCAALGVPAGWAAAGAPVAWSASLWPDWDHPQATLARKLGPITYAFSRWVERRFGGHRAGTHSLLVGVPLAGALGGLLGLPVAVWGSWWLLVPVLAGAAAVGALSHVVLDCVTCNCRDCVAGWKLSGRHRAGCEVVWPMVKRRFGLPLVVVGGGLERLVRPGLWLAAGAGVFLIVSG